jgi:hypothetical protein
MIDFFFFLRKIDYELKIYKWRTGLLAIKKKGDPQIYKEEINNLTLEPEGAHADKYSLGTHLSSIHYIRYKLARSM